MNPTRPTSSVEPLKPLASFFDSTGTSPVARHMVGAFRGPLIAIKQLLCATALAAGFMLALPTQAQAAPSPSNTVKGDGGNTGVGMTLGSPVGFSLKHFMSPKSALQWNLGWGILHHGNFRTDLTYLWHPAAIAKSDIVDLVPYFGAGLGFGMWGNGHWHGHEGGHRNNGVNVGIMFRLPALGLALHWQKVPLDTVLEGAWSPMVEIHQGGANFGANHGDIFLGLRYYF